MENKQEISLEELIHILSVQLFVVLEEFKGQDSLKDEEVFVKMVRGLCGDIADMMKTRLKLRVEGGVDTTEILRNALREMRASQDERRGENDRN